MASIEVLCERRLISVKLVTSLPAYEFLLWHDKVMDTYTKRVILTDIKWVNIGKEANRRKWWICYFGIRSKCTNAVEVLKKILTPPLEKALMNVGYGTPIEDFYPPENRLRLSGSLNGDPLSVREISILYFLEYQCADQALAEGECRRVSENIKDEYPQGILPYDVLYKLSTQYGIEGGSWIMFSRRWNVRFKFPMNSSSRNSPSDSGSVGDSAFLQLSPEEIDKQNKELSLQALAGYKKALHSVLFGSLANIDYVRRISYRKYPNGDAFFRVYNNKSIYLEEIATNGSVVDSFNFLRKDAEVDDVIHALEEIFPECNYSPKYKCDLYSTLNCNSFTVPKGTPICFYSRFYTRFFQKGPQGGYVYVPVPHPASRNPIYEKKTWPVTPE